MNIELIGVDKVYRVGKRLVHALNNVDLVLKEGELVSIIGPSGSGKTTLLNIIGGLERPTGGRVMVGKKDITLLPDRTLSSLRLRTFGFVFQSFFLIPHLTAIENVMVPMREAGSTRSASRRDAGTLLKKVDIENRAHHLPMQMSGGEQQRVAIARALANDPPIILADEPTGELDSGNSRLIMGLLRDLNREEKRTVVVVTHDPQVSKVCTRNYRISDGALSH